MPRENPRRLFVRDPLPSTEAAGTSTASPALGGTPGRPPLRTPGSANGLRITPGRRGDAGPAENGGYVLAGATPWWWVLLWWLLLQRVVRLRA